MASLETIAEMLDFPTHDIDGWTIKNTDDSRHVFFDYDEGNAQVHVGPRYDGTYAVVATESQHIGTVGRFPQTKEYRRVWKMEDTIEEATDLCEKYESQIASQSTNPQTVPVEEVVDRLIEEGSQFIAIPEDFLAYGVFSVVFGEDDDIEMSSISEYWDDIEAVEVGHSTLPCGDAIPIEFSDYHFGGRVPLYAAERTSSPLRTVGAEQGLTNLQNYIERARDDELVISPKTADLESILTDLVDAGAAAIAIEEEVSHSKRLTFSVFLHPAVGYEIVTEYSAVEVDGREIDVDWECRTTGPSFHLRTPVFASDNIIGMDSFPLSEGLTNVREFVETAQNPQTGDTQ